MSFLTDGRWAKAVSVLATGGVLLLAVAAPAAAGAKGTACHKCVADTTPPTISISSPAAGTIVSGTFTLSGVASDAGGVARIDVQVDSEAFTSASGTTSWNASVGTQALSNGTHKITARAMDTSGNVASTAITVSVNNVAPDSSPPSVTITSPASSSTTSGSIVVAGSASDNVSVKTVQIQIDSGLQQSASGTESWSLPLDTSAYANGTHTLTASATDTAGNKSAATLTFTISNATTAGSDVVLNDPVALNGLQLLGRGRAAEWGGTSVLLYWEESTSHRGAFFRDSLTGATSYVPLPVDNDYGWSNAAYVMTSANDLWLFGGNGPMSLRHFVLAGSPLPSSATLASDQSFGDSDSRQGDFVELASGALLTVWHQQGATGPQGIWYAYAAPSSTTFAVTGPLQFAITKASKQVAVQHPVDGSVWIFTNADATGVIGAIHLTEGLGALSVDWADNTFLDVKKYGGFGPDPENPDLAAAPDTANGTVDVAYQSTTRYMFATNPTVVTGSYPVVARITADGLPSFVQLPTYVERISSIGLYVSSDELRLTYRPVDPATLTFDHLYSSAYRNGAWQPPAQLGRLYTSYERVNFSVSRDEMSARLADGKLHLFLLT
jgi:hypothetical protein